LPTPPGPTSVGILEHALDRLELRRPADERRALGGEPLHPHLERLQEREVARQPLDLELKDALGRGEVLEAVRAEVANRRLDERPRGLGEADVSLRGQPRLTRVEPHPHPDRAACQRALSILGGCDGIRRPTEGGEERVTLGIHLDPVVRGEGGAQNAAMLVQGPGVALAELLEQPCRALHVGEEQRDHARGTIAGHPQRS
jgi:hypothetical protein